MDNTSARCKDSEEAYKLAFSRDVRDVQHMINDYCYQCPVRLTCLLEAIGRDYYGVWGGHTRKERAKLKGIQTMLS